MKLDEETTTTLNRLRRSLAKAKQRALYWSGTPSFTGKRFRPSARRRNGGSGDHYELAMNDIENLRMQIQEITGRPPKDYDPKARWVRVFSALQAGMKKPKD